MTKTHCCVIIVEQSVEGCVIFGPVVQLVRTLACHARGRRFDPVPDRHWLSIQRAKNYAGIAQEVERILGKDEVTSSNLVISSLKYDEKARNYQGFLPCSCIQDYPLIDT